MIKILLNFLFLSIGLFAQTEAILKLDTQGHTSLINDLIVTKDGDIISASDDRTIIVWDSRTGLEKRKILGQIGFNSGKIYAIALSSDERYLAVGGLLTGDRSNKTAIRIYNYQTGKLLHVLKSHTNVVKDLAFSNDSSKSNFLISGSADKTAKIWSVQDNFRLKDTIKFHTDFVYAVKIIKKKENYFAITAGQDNQIALYDIQKRKVIQSDKLNYKLSSLATNIELKHIAVCGGKEITIYNYNLQKIRTIKSKTKAVGLAYDKKGNFLLVGRASRPNNVNLYKAKNNYSLYKSFKKHKNLTKAVAFLEKNNKLYAISAGGNNDDIFIWDIVDMKVQTKIEGVGSSIWSVGLKDDEIAWGNTRTKTKGQRKFQKSISLKTFKISDKIAGFKRILTKNGEYSLSTSKGGDYGYGGAVLNIKKDGVLQAKIIKNATDGYNHLCYGWYKDFIISGGSSGHLIIYNKQGKAIASLIGHTGEVWSITVDGDRLVSGSADQTIKVWNLSSIVNKVKYDEKFIKYIMNKYEISRKNVFKQAKKKNDQRLYITQTINPIINIFVSEGNEYITWTKEGFFNSSKNGAKYIGYHINNGVDKEAEYVTVDSLYTTFYRPDLIQKTLHGASLAKYSKNINIQKLLKDGLAPEVHILTKTKKTKNQDLDLKVQVCPKGNGGYDNLTLLINDMPVSVINTSRALKLKKKSKRDDCFIYDQTISLSGGLNNIGFRATNIAGNIESKPDYLEVSFDDTNLKKKLRSKLAKISGSQNINDLHILAIAVNDYKDKELTLNYSINDATVMLDTIQTVSAALFNKVHTYKLFDSEVTKENIKQIFKSIKSTRDDVFLLYIAGHGITDEYNGNYYYIPYDFISNNDKNAVQIQGVGQKDLMLGLSNITALKSLVLLDTCNSGSFVEADMLKTTTNRLARATGRATISASSKSQVALEGYNGHGVFTYTLIEALKGKGYNKDNKITITELNDYVQNTLPNRTNNKWGYKQIPQSSMYGTDFNIGARDKE